MEEKQTIHVLVISNIVLLCFFIIQKAIDFVLAKLKKAEEKKDANIEEMSDKIHETQLQLAGLKVQVDSILQLMNSYGEIKKGIEELNQNIKNNRRRK